MTSLNLLSVKPDFGERLLICQTNGSELSIMILANNSKKLFWRITELKKER